MTSGNGRSVWQRRYGRFVATTKTGRVVAKAGPTAQATAGAIQAGFAPKIGRIPIRFLHPQQPENRWPAKAYAG